MSDGLMLEQELGNEIEAAFQANEEFRAAGIELAAKRAEARKALKTQMLAYRAQGYPATLIPKLAEGAEAVSNATFEADCAQAEYDAAREVVLLRKRKIDVIREQISRDWEQARRLA